MKPTPLKLLIVESGTPQYVLAAQVGVNETRMSRIARGRSPPTPDERARIAAALGVPESSVFGEAGASAD